jgi:hypothetical protein
VRFKQTSTQPLEGNVRKLLAIAALAALGVSSAAAQSSMWTAELGVQGGFAKVKPAGTGLSDAQTFIELPVGTLTQQLFMGGPLYAIIPAGKKLAIEPQFGFTQVSAGAQLLTLGRLTVRGDYALNPKVYVAAGVSVGYADVGPAPTHEQLGVTVAAGYRVHVVGATNARVEANWLVTKNAQGLLGPFSAYQVLLGVSSSVKAPARASRARAAGQAWDRVLGVSGGYFGMRNNGGSLGGFAFPGVGGSLSSATASGFPPLTTLFAIVPLGGKLALEPGFDFHHTGVTGASVSAISVSGRLDYAATGNWYGALGGNLMSLSQTGGPNGSVTGLQVAWGYRFHLVGAFGGRFEGSYLMAGRSTKLGFTPTNTFGLTFGATMPLQ